MSRPESSRWLLAVALATVAVAGVAALAPERVASAGGGFWILLGSDRDGQERAYSVRPDGSRLTPLLSLDRALDPIAVSLDGRTIAYIDYPESTHVYVSRANGTGLRQLVPYKGGPVALSRDGKLLAFEKEGGIWIVAADGHGLRRLTAGDDDESDWSPDGKAVAFVRRSTDQEHLALVVQLLRGGEHVLARGPVTAGPGSPRWSPDGRWIAYDAGDTGLWLVRSDGTVRRRVARGDIAAFAWSPDGKTIAYSSSTAHDVVVIGADGQGSRRLPVRGMSFSRLSWSPDSRLLALGSPDTWVVGVDGRGLRRVASGVLAGWTPLAPARPPAAPMLPSERVLDARTVETRRPVVALSADGSRVAVIVGRTAADCDHVVVWTSATRDLDRFVSPAPCREGGHDSGPTLYAVALAGSRAAWASYFDCGNYCHDVRVTTATLAQRSTVAVVSTSDQAGSGIDFHLHGAGDLLVFNEGSGLVRIGSGHGNCPDGGGVPLPAAAICTTLRDSSQACCVDSVVGALIALRESDAVAVLDGQGKLVRVFPFAAGEVGAARLDGGSLVVARAGVIEVYDAATGAAQLQRPLPSDYELADVDGGIAVLRQKNTIRLLKLSDGRSLTLTPGRGPVFADLEPPGLYYSYATGDGRGRLIFLPRTEVLRRIGAGS